jgi:phosphoribosylformylglycinamidine synthase
MSNIGIIVFPGTNCDLDLFYVLKYLLKANVQLIWHTKDKIGNYDAIVLPGGFAFGDRLRAGIIAAHSPIIKEIKRMANDGVPTLGICNGFQILLESGLLPGALSVNYPAGFVCEWTEVEILNTNTPFTHKFKKSQRLEIPIAHGQGRYLADPKTIKNLRKKNQIVLKYCNGNPNGSLQKIAGICNEEGNVLGIMPHPERASEKVLVPNRASNNAILVFQSLLYYTNKNASDKLFSQIIT